MKKTLSSLPKGFLCSYLRNQPTEVKQNVYKGLGVFTCRVPKTNQSS